MHSPFSITGVNPDSIGCFRFLRKAGSVRIYEMSETATEISVSGVQVYSTTSQLKLRRIINEQFGTKRNPWCYVQNTIADHWNRGNLSFDSVFWWKVYSAEPKQVAFKGSLPYGFRGVSIINKILFMRHYGYDEQEFAAHLDDFYRENPPWQDRFNNYFEHLDENGMFRNSIGK